MTEPLEAKGGTRQPAVKGGDGAAADPIGGHTMGILDAIDIPVVVLGRACKVSRFNRAAAETLGVTSADVDRPACEMRALTGVPEIEQMCLQVMADGLPSRLEMRNGDRWFLVRIAPYTGTGAAVGGLVLTFTNFTAFRASLGQAVYEREYTKNILNAVIDPLVVLDGSLRIQTANRAFYEWFGASRDQTHGVPLSNLGDDEWSASGLWPSLKEMLSHDHEFQTIELERDFPNAGRRTILLDARSLVRDGHALVLVSFRDISKRKQAEETLRELNRRKDEFLATLAHELRNPLAPIRQASAISRAAAATEEQKRWSHDVIERQVRHMALLLDDLLDISRVTRGTLELRPQMTDLTTIIARATETAQPLIEAKRHALKIEVPDGAARFAADPLRLAQALSNLLTNAAKYTDPEGEICLRAMCSADTVTLSIADNGIGIPQNALENIFVMFSQVKSGQDRSEDGLGIGLALARGLVHLHGGTLEVRSEGIGSGSEFIMKLPRRTLSIVPKGPAVAFGPSVSRCVLIADDNRDAADSLAMLLRIDGHDVVVVHDGKQAVAKIESLAPEIALLDIGMPELNGYEVARRVRQGPLGASITLVAVTGWGQASDKARATAAGFNHHLTKPIEPDALAKVLGSEF
ncbi:MAG: ATP-binding protein [Steroidobacteraceae bacterium]